MLQKIDTNLFNNIIESMTIEDIPLHIPNYVDMVHKCMTELHWDHICRITGLFQIPNMEFISSLYNDINTVRSALNIGENILEIGCGNGWLSYLLQKKGLNIISSDSGHLYKKTNLEWHRPRPTVDICPYDDALEKYKPELVIICWMPIYEDWTHLIRTTKSVKAYILIGEGEGGRCGTKRTFTLPYREGWTEIKLPSSKYCISATDRGYRINFQKLTHAGLWIKNKKAEQINSAIKKVENNGNI